MKKMASFWQFFFEKKWQVFGNFLTVKWQFSGGSDPNQRSPRLYLSLFHVECVAGRPSVRVPSRDDVTDTGPPPDSRGLAPHTGLADQWGGHLAPSPRP